MAASRSRRGHWGLKEEAVRVLLDEGTNRVAINYSVMTAPETVLIAPNGLVAKKIVGPITYEKLVAGIEC